MSNPILHTNTSQSHSVPIASTSADFNDLALDFDEDDIDELLPDLSDDFDDEEDHLNDPNSFAYYITNIRPNLHTPPISHVTSGVGNDHMLVDDDTSTITTTVSDLMAYTNVIIHENMDVSSPITGNTHHSVMITPKNVSIHSSLAKSAKKSTDSTEIDINGDDSDDGHMAQYCDENGIPLSLRSMNSEKSTEIASFMLHNNPFTLSSLSTPEPCSIEDLVTQQQLNEFATIIPVNSRMIYVDITSKQTNPATIQHIHDTNASRGHIGFKNVHSPSVDQLQLFLANKRKEHRLNGLSDTDLNQHGGVDVHLKTEFQLIVWGRAQLAWLIALQRLHQSHAFLTTQTYAVIKQKQAVFTQRYQELLNRYEAEQKTLKESQKNQTNRNTKNQPQKNAPVPHVSDHYEDDISLPTFPPAQPNPYPYTLQYNNHVFFTALHHGKRLFNDIKQAHSIIHTQLKGDMIREAELRKSDAERIALERKEQMIADRKARDLKNKLAMKKKQHLKNKNKQKGGNKNNQGDKPGDNAQNHSGKRTSEVTNKDYPNDTVGSFSL